VRSAQITDALGQFTALGLPLRTYDIVITEPITNSVAFRTATVALNGEAVDLGVILLDNTGPTVVQTTPSANAAGVDPTTQFAFEFSEPLDPASVTADTLLVSISGL